MILSVKYESSYYVIVQTEIGFESGVNINREDVMQWILEGNTPEPEFTEEELQAKAYEEAITTWKVNRQNLVDNIEVTYDGIVYQGDEVSQTRMSRAITALPDDTTTVPWVAKDNTVHSLNRVELKGLLFQAGLEQSTIWNEGRPE